MTKARSIGITCSLAGLLCSGFWLLRAQRNDTRGLPELLPPGALFYLEARDLHKLVSEWNNSTEKAKWLGGANFEVVAQSRLVQRLAQAQTEFETVAGVPVAMDMLAQVAGGQSALAFYDLPSLSFVYLTRLDDSRLSSSDLWKKRAGYTTRQVAGIAFFVKEEHGDAARKVAFASYDGWLVIATDADRMARTLLLLARQPAAALGDEAWFKATTAAAERQGDLRLVYQLTTLLKTPQFRTYWIQRNASELEAFASGIADLFEQPNAFEERRAMLRATPGTPTAEDGAGLAEVLAHVPASSSLYRAWATPEDEVLGRVLEQVISGMPAQHKSLERDAPEIRAEASVVGSVSDLETRIDEPEYKRAQQQALGDVVRAIATMQPTALLHAQATTLLSDGVFVMPQSEAVILCRHPDLEALNRSIGASTSLVKTAGLDPLRVSVSGNLVVLSRMPGTKFAAIPVSGPGASYAAGYEHAAEWPRYRELFTDIDHGATNPDVAGAANTPAFFSRNLESLGDALIRVTRASIVTRDDQAIVRDSVRYDLQ
jgi:hypothetical protein